MLEPQPRREPPESLLDPTAAYFEQPQRILLPVNIWYMAFTVLLALLFNLMPWRDLIGVPDMVALALSGAPGSHAQGGHLRARS